MYQVFKVWAMLEEVVESEDPGKQLIDKYFAASRYCDAFARGACCEKMKANQAWDLLAPLASQWAVVTVVVQLYRCIATTTTTPSLTICH